MTFDLHTHSSVSDGTQRPADVVASAVEAGLSGLALTDHDTTAGWSEAAEAAVHHGIGLIPGMEITTRTEDGISVHMLSYLHDPDYVPLAETIAESRDGRMLRTERMTRLLAEDFPITWESVLAQVAPGATIGRPHIADALVAAGVVGERGEAFLNQLHPHSRYYVPQHSITPTQAVQLVREAGGVPVIAHAMAAARGRTISDEQLHELVDAGLMGVEVYHRDNPAGGRQRLLDVAADRNLLVSGSSDYHGAGKPNRLGEYTTDHQTVQRLLEMGTGTSAIGIG